MNYSHQLTTVKSIPIQEGESKRLVCPFCHSRSTFGIRKVHGVLEWQCFRASCGCKGKATGTRNLETIRKLVETNTPSIAVPTAKKKKPLPTIVSDVENHPKIIDWLKRVHSYQAYKDKRAMIKYAPKENRVLFYMNDGTGAVGRAMDGRLPKWYEFGNTVGLFTVGNSPDAVLVEDAPSACAIPPEFTGVALLGTSITTLQRSAMALYKSVTVCLDRDAAKKSLTLANSLRPHLGKVSVRFLDDDLKWLEPHQIRKVLLNER